MVLPEFPWLGSFLEAWKAQLCLAALYTPLRMSLTTEFRKSQHYRVNAFQGEGLAILGGITDTSLFKPLAALRP